MDIERVIIMRLPWCAMLHQTSHHVVLMVMIILTTQLTATHTFQNTRPTQ